MAEKQSEIQKHRQQRQGHLRWFLLLPLPPLLPRVDGDRRLLTPDEGVLRCCNCCSGRLDLRRESASVADSVTDSSLDVTEMALDASADNGEEGFGIEVMKGWSGEASKGSISRLVLSSQ